MKELTLIFATIFSLTAFSQSKKEQIAILTNRLDSITIVLKSERSENAARLSKSEIKIKEMENQISLLNKNISKLTTELQLIKKEDELKKNEITNLKNELLLLEDSIKDLRRTKKYPLTLGKSIYLPNEARHLYTCVFDFLQTPQILTDSLFVKLNDNLMYSFYFFTPITKELNIQCPYEFGYVVYDSNGKEIMKSLTPEGNYFGGYLEFDLGTRKRRLLGLGSSGCGSGGSINYFEIEIKDGQINLSNKFEVSTGGYETTCFVAEKKYYVYLKRINPEAHWAGDTRYELSFYSLIDDHLICRKETKYIYPHFGDVEEGDLLKSIERREPNFFKF
jgi:hypothetical protein